MGPRADKIDEDPIRILNTLRSETDNTVSPDSYARTVGQRPVANVCYFARRTWPRFRRRYYGDEHKQ
jgi:hypothetical protein